MHNHDDTLDAYTGVKDSSSRGNTPDPLESELRVFPCSFSANFWPELIERMLAQAATVPLTRQLIIVPDNSMILAYRAAWAAQAQRTRQAYLLPSMMTLMDWAKAHGAQDWDAQDTERMLNWMQVLPQAQILREALGQNVEAGDDLLGLSRLLIGMSDELSLHLLAGRDVAWVKNAVEQAIQSIYNQQTHRIAQQELAILLHCWQADVDKQTPVVGYLAVLQQMARNSARAHDCVWVLRNRPWTAHETEFWQQYAQHSAVWVLDIQTVQVRVGAQRQAAITCIAGEWAPRWAGTVSNQAGASEALVPFLRAHNLEDEAQAVVRQVLAWRAQGLRQIALVALDRQVSRRVWALLRRVGVDIRDDTGWLLSTSRAASAWFEGLRLWQGEVLAQALLSWLSHPMVLADWPSERKSAVLTVLYALADRQRSVQPPRIWRTWSDWLAALAGLQKRSPTLADWSEPDTALAYADAHWLLQYAQSAHAENQRARPLKHWAQAVMAWAQTVGLWTALMQDNAGQKWCELLRRWLWVDNEAPLTLATFLRLMNAEVERLTYRPPSLSVDESGVDEVILLPLGNTRLRTFDAVWLLGADAGNLPGAEQDLGLLNWAVRQDLGLPTVQDKQVQMRIALLDLFALNPQLCASYSAQKDGTPNALSPWLQQYLRAQGGVVQDIERIEEQVAPQVHTRSAVAVADHLPQQISATDLNSISACPYQYHVKKVLAIAPKEWPDEEIQASDKGTLWHSIVERFHRGRDASQAEQDVERFIEVVDACVLPLCADNARYWSIHQQFQAYAEAFVAWWQAREREGWQVKHSEYQPEQVPLQPITDASGRQVHQLHWRGRIDQVDERRSELGVPQWSLIDYKTNSVRNYQSAIRDGEDTQLAFYVHLIESARSSPDAEVVDARYVGVDRHMTDDLPEAVLGDAGYIHQQAEQLRAQVHALFLRMAQGAPLVAFGEKSACVYCDYRAVCRKDYTMLSVVSTPQGGA